MFAVFYLCNSQWCLPYAGIFFCLGLCIYRIFLWMSFCPGFLSSTRYTWATRVFLTMGWPLCHLLQPRGVAPAAMCVGWRLAGDVTRAFWAGPCRAAYIRGPGWNAWQLRKGGSLLPGRLSLTSQMYIKSRHSRCSMSHLPNPQARTCGIFHGLLLSGNIVYAW